MRLTLLAILLVGAGARGEVVNEPSTGHGFEASRADGGKSFTLVGTGVRKKFIVKVYAMGLYVESEGAKKASRGGDPQAFVAGGSFGKLAVLHFVRDVDAGKIQQAYRDGLETELGDPSTKALAEAFVAAFDRDVKDGQEIVVRTSGDGKISVAVAGSKKDVGQSARLAKAIWNIWLGAKPISPDMRKTLVERVDAIGK
jgi:hypothetical protein